jgi:hypothetical protein
VLQRDARGNLRPVAYYSRCLSPSGGKYSTYQRELLAIRDCLLAFRFYLVGLPLVCKTDHCSLQWLTEQADMSPLQSRWYTVFLEYHIKEIQYTVFLEYHIKEIHIKARRMRWILTASRSSGTPFQHRRR